MSVKAEEILRLVTAEQIGVVKDDVLGIISEWTKMEKILATPQEVMAQLANVVENPAFGMWVMLRRGEVAALLTAHAELGIAILGDNMSVYVDLLEIIPQRVENVTSTVRAMLDVTRAWARELGIDKIVHISHHVTDAGDPSRSVRKRFCRTEGRAVGTVIEIRS